MNFFRLQEEFYRQYYSVKDPLRLYGFPISEQFTDPTTGTILQYFQKARFELRQTPSGREFKLTPLGEMLYDKKEVQPANVDNSGPTCRFFPKSQFNVCYAFNNFYAQYNGETTLGEPISGLVIRNGRTSQCFENACLEWRGDMSLGEMVVVVDLGRTAYDRFEGMRVPSAKYGIPGITTFQVRAFVSRSLINLNEKQVITTIVTDLEGKPRSGASVEMTIIHPNGTPEILLNTPNSNSFGLSQFTLPVSRWKVADVVQVLITVEFAGEKHNTATWFRIWY